MTAPSRRPCWWPADLPALPGEGALLPFQPRFALGPSDTRVPECPLRAVIECAFPAAMVMTWPGGHLLHEEQGDKAEGLTPDTLRALERAR